jgi:hypothetical protein
MHRLVAIGIVTLIGAMPVCAVESSASLDAYLLCESRGGGDSHENCILVNSQGQRLNRELFDTHRQAVPTDGMLRITANVAKATGGYDWRKGFINTRGEVVVPPIYKEANQFSDGLCLVTTEQGRAYIDTQGKIVLALEARWMDAHDFHHGLALVRGKGYTTGNHPASSVGRRRVAPPWSVIDKTGRIVMGYDPDKDPSPATRYTELEWYGSHRYTAPDINIRSDFIDGKAVFSPGSAAPHGDREALGLIDTQGQVVTRPSAHVSEQRLREAIDKPALSQKPSAALRERFPNMGDFHEGLAWVAIHETDQYGTTRSVKKGFVDEQGRWVIQVDLSAYLHQPFRNGHAVLLINDVDDPQRSRSQQEVLIDRTGRAIARFAPLTPELRKP